MKHQYLTAILSFTTAISLITGCSSSASVQTQAAQTAASTQNESKTTSAAAPSETTAGNETTASASADGTGVRSEKLITNVYGDGQKAWTAVLEYGADINPASVSADDFEVEDYDIKAVYVNNEAVIPESGKSGKYVLIELDTESYTTTNYGGTGKTDAADVAEALEEKAASGTQDSGKIPVDSSDNSKPSGPQNGGSMNGQGGGAGMGSSVASNQLTVKIKQKGDISAVDGTVLSGSDTEYATDYKENTNLFVENFTQYTFTTSDGTKMMYSLYLPEGYETTQYPMMTFMPDATGEGDDPYLALTESLGASVWITKERQKKYPSIVLVPQYTNDNSANDAYTMELINAVAAKYHADTNRLYLSGQSSGTIRSIKLFIDYPDVFAAAMLTAGQADSAYTDKLSSLAGQKIWMICSAGDARAYPGMQAVTDAVKTAGTNVITSQWSAKLSDEEQENNCAKMENTASNIYWTVYDKGTVMRNDVASTDATEHMNTWRVSYTLDTVMDWVYSQKK